MPLYEFRCAEHGTFDRFLPEPQPSDPCPTCGEPAPRVWSMGPVIFRPWGYSLPMDHPDFWKNVKDREDRPQWQR